MDWGYLRHVFCGFNPIVKQNRKERNELLNKLKDKLSKMNKSGKGGTTVSLNPSKKTKRPRMTRTPTVMEALKSSRPQEEIKKKMSTVLEGTIKWFSREKGYGFIASGENNQDYFFHHSQVNNKDILSEGDEVSFNTEKDSKGWRAINISKQMKNNGGMKK